MPNRILLPKTRACLAGIVIGAAFLLLARSLGLYPTVFADEYTYSKFARLVPLNGAEIPSYLYFWTYSATRLCGDGFLSCARLLNVLFFVLAAPFIYLLGKKLTGERTALLIAALSVLGPINTYTAYFMPESLYFLCFWIFTYFALSLRREHRVLHWSSLGILFGITALVKPHALFLMPALAVYFLYIQMQFTHGRPSASHVTQYAAFFLSALATKFVISFILAGRSGITFFGPSYSSVAAASILDAGRYIDLMRLALDNLRGHVLALSVLFSVAIAHLLRCSPLFLRRVSEPRTSLNVALYAALTLAVLLTVVIAFTASISGAGPYESTARLHMRYYNFAFPLLFLICASQLSADAIATSTRSRAIVGVPIGAAILYAAYTHLTPYTPSLVDSPEVRGITIEKAAFYFLSGASLFSLASWVHAERTGARIFLYIFLPLAVAISSVHVNKELTQRLVPDRFDKAGIFARQYLSSEDLARTVVVGSEPGGLFRSLYYLDNPSASLQTIPPGSAYDLSELPAGKTWALVIGDHELPKDRYRLPMDGFTLVLANSAIDFRRSVWPGVIASSRGLSVPEPWGTWSSSDAVILEFSVPLPETFNIHLVAHAYGPNAEREFVAHVGDTEVRFTLGTLPEKKVLRFDNPSRSRIISIDVPAPTSPRELGLSADARPLGIGLTGLRIEPIRPQ